MIVRGNLSEESGRGSGRWSGRWSSRWSSRWSGGWSGDDQQRRARAGFRPARAGRVFVDHPPDHPPDHLPDHLPHHLPDHLPDHLTDHLPDNPQTIPSPNHPIPKRSPKHRPKTTPPILSSLPACRASASRQAQPWRSPLAEPQRLARWLLFGMMMADT